MPNADSVNPPFGAHLSLTAVGKSFGDKAVLHDIAMEIPPGSFVSIVGRSGCGKSTLLRLLMGLDAPTSGTLQSDAAESARIVFQEPRLLPWASVADNVAVGLGSAARSSDAIAKAVEALQQVGLGDRAGEWPSVLSGGQRQRVALARALVSHPRLLALDEPLGALDALTRIEMQQLLEDVWKAQGFTALLVTHDVSEAVALGDRVVLIEQGRIAMDITVDLPRPRHRGDATLAAIEGRILDHLLGTGDTDAH